MKYVMIMTLVIVTGCAGSCAVRTAAARACESSVVEQAEVFEGSGTGYRGPVQVQVRLNKGIISEILILESMEDRFVGEAAIEELIEIVIENNSTDVDAVSGATVSSWGFLEAVNNAILKHE